MKKIVLDIETTGLNTNIGDRIIELACIELIDRKKTGKLLHMYFNPDRIMSQNVIDIHNINNNFLLDKPRFSESIYEIMSFIKSSELIIHNAPFDVKFLNYELSLLQDNQWGKIEEHCKIFDTLKFAQKKYPGKKNNLDALCKRYHIDNSLRIKHGALIDAKLLMKIYLKMTSGQILLFNKNSSFSKKEDIYIKNNQKFILPVIKATKKELKLHEFYCKMLSNISGEDIRWI